MTDWVWYDNQLHWGGREPAGDLHFKCLVLLLLLLVPPSDGPATTGPTLPRSLPGWQQSVLDMLALIQVWHLTQVLESDISQFESLDILRELKLELNKVCSLLAVATAAPQFRAISEVVNSQTGGISNLNLCICICVCIRIFICIVYNARVVNSRTGCNYILLTPSTPPEVIPVDVNNQDIGGCLVGPSGERVCPLVAVGSDGRSQVKGQQQQQQQKQKQTRVR